MLCCAVLQPPRLSFPPGCSVEDGAPQQPTAGQAADPLLQAGSVQTGLGLAQRAGLATAASVTMSGGGHASRPPRPHLRLRLRPFPSLSPPMVGSFLTAFVDVD